MEVDFEVNFTIGSGVFGGALLGAIVAICFIGFFSLLGAATESLMNLGGLGDFWHKFKQGAKIYVPAGMIIGGVTGNFMSAWIAIPVMIGTFVILIAIQAIINKRKRR